jgi:hypothetical protein
MSFLDRVNEVIPHTGRAWLEALVIAAGLVLVIVVVLPRVLKWRALRWGVSAGLLVAAGWFTVAPAFFDKRVDERLLGATAAPAPKAPSTVTGPAATAAPAGPVKVTTGPLQGLAGHYGKGAASVYRLPDGSHFVRLEAIDTPHAPAVYVYLVPRAGQTGPDGGVDLGALKGNQGSQNYVVPPGVDVARYQTVLLWCRRFATPIAAATQSLT